MGQIPPDHPQYQEWLLASNRLLKAADRLEALSQLPEGDPELLAAHSEWLAAKTAYQAFCAKTDEPA